MRVIGALCATRALRLSVITSRPTARSRTPQTGEKKLTVSEENKLIHAVWTSSSNNSNADSAVVLVALE